VLAILLLFEQFFTFTIIHLADTFIQRNLQMRTTVAVKLTVEQQYLSTMTPSQFNLMQSMQSFIIIFLTIYIYIYIEEKRKC